MLHQLADVLVDLLEGQTLDLPWTQAVEVGEGGELLEQVRPQASPGSSSGVAASSGSVRSMSLS